MESMKGLGYRKDEGATKEYLIFYSCFDSKISYIAKNDLVSDFIGLFKTNSK